MVLVSLCSLNDRYFTRNIGAREVLFLLFQFGPILSNVHKLSFCNLEMELFNKYSTIHDSKSSRDDNVLNNNRNPHVSLHLPLPYNESVGQGWSVLMCYKLSIALMGNNDLPKTKGPGYSNTPITYLRSFLLLCCSRTSHGQYPCGFRN